MRFKPLTVEQRALYTVFKIDLRLVTHNLSNFKIDLSVFILIESESSAIASVFTVKNHEDLRMKHNRSCKPCASLA